MSIEASAASNIALIKYMGKQDSRGSNVPTNSSLSWTLPSLRTVVRLTAQPGVVDAWQPLQGDQFFPMELSKKGEARFLEHFAFLKKSFNLSGAYLIESANNFPSDCGLASSASSFAALTAAANQLAVSQGQQSVDVVTLSDLSRKASGSSIRSFFGPWCLWSESGAKPLEFPINQIFHQVLVVESRKKDVSSSEAHRRVLTSDLFEGRPARAEKRLAKLCQALRTKNWQDAFEITWAEFWDMHALFETSKPSFGYMQSATMDILQKARELWQQEKDGPLVTMDAGPNVHLLWRSEQKSKAEQFTSQFAASVKVINSELA